MAGGVMEELLARRRQGGVHLVADEEASAELVLQRADAGADRGLADMQAFGGPDEAAGGDDGEEGADQVDIHAAHFHNRNSAFKHQLNSLVGIIKSQQLRSAQASRVGEHV